MNDTIRLYDENEEPAERPVNLLETLDTQQNDVLEKLDELNEQIEQLLAQVGSERANDKEAA